LLRPRTHQLIGPTFFASAMRVLMPRLRILPLLRNLLEILKA
jgi:hypothetical protein